MGHKIYGWKEERGEGRKEGEMNERKDEDEEQRKNEREGWEQQLRNLSTTTKMGRLKEREGKKIC